MMMARRLFSSFVASFPLSDRSSLLAVKVDTRIYAQFLC
ncbi:hypothetical protein R2A130_2038 [Ahrensia sp. R2A130]|nr:hypothetical protein R2A130_2038 [Ahrensia sp. R2A130]